MNMHSHQFLKVPGVRIVAPTSPPPPDLEPDVKVGEADNDRLYPPTTVAKKGSKSKKANGGKKGKAKSGPKGGPTRTAGRSKVNKEFDKWPAPTLPHLEYKNPMRGQSHHVFSFPRRFDDEGLHLVIHEITSVLLLNRIPVHNFEFNRLHMDTNGVPCKGVWSEFVITTGLGFGDFFVKVVREKIKDYAGGVKTHWRVDEHRSNSQVWDEMKRRLDCGFVSQ